MIDSSPFRCLARYVQSRAGWACRSCLGFEGLPAPTGSELKDEGRVILLERMPKIRDIAKSSKIRTKLQQLYLLFLGKLHRYLPSSSLDS